MSEKRMAGVEAELVDGATPVTWAMSSGEWQSSEEAHLLADGAVARLVAAGLAHHPNRDAVDGELCGRRGGSGRWARSGSGSSGGVHNMAPREGASGPRLRLRTGPRGRPRRRLRRPGRSSAARCRRARSTTSRTGRARAPGQELDQGLRWPRPSTGGAASWILRRPSCSPTTRVREARGWTRISSDDPPPGASRSQGISGSRRAADLRLVGAADHLVRGSMTSVEPASTARTWQPDSRHRVDGVGADGGQVEAAVLLRLHRLHHAPRPPWRARRRADAGVGALERLHRHGDAVLHHHRLPEVEPADGAGQLEPVAGVGPLLLGGLALPSTPSRREPCPGGRRRGSVTGRPRSSRRRRWPRSTLSSVFAASRDDSRAEPVEPGVPEEAGLGDGPRASPPRCTRPLQAPRPPCRTGRASPRCSRRPALRAPGRSGSRGPPRLRGGPPCVAFSAKRMGKRPPPAMRPMVAIATAGCPALTTR